MQLDASNRAGALAFLTAAVTLFTQILVHRVVSAKVVNNFAFLVISLTLLGFALAGVILSLWQERLFRVRDEALSLSASLFSITTLGACALFYRMDAGPQYVSLGQDFLLRIGRWVPLTLPWAVPFAFCGFILGMLLSDPRLPTRRIYFFDLIGSAVGAFAVIPVVKTAGVESGIVVASAAMAGGALLLAPPRSRVARAMVAFAAAVTLAGAVARERVFEMTYPTHSMLWHYQRLPPPYGIEYIAWDPVSRIEISRTPPPRLDQVPAPSLFGDDRAFLERFTRVLTQNNFAVAHAVEYHGDPDELRGIERTAYAAAYRATSVESPRALVVGVGAGLDVLAALSGQASVVTGLEVNEATVDILRHVFADYFRGWMDDPRVRIVAAEGRHFLSTTPGPWDIIQLSGVDSYSGTPGAAHVFSENYLYTTEAFDLYLSRLSSEGIINMMRADSEVPRDMLRALTTAVAALRRSGAQHPARHIITLADVTGRYAVLLVKRTPFTEAEQRRVVDWAASTPYLRVSAAPGENDAGGNVYARFLALNDPRKEESFIRAYPCDVSPVSDDRPFFFRSSRWRQMVTSTPLEDNYNFPVMEYTVLALLGIVCGAAAVCIYLPLRALASRGLHVAGAARYAVYFAALGLGYIAVEVALLQKFGLFLGHPNYALSVVLASLLLTTGLGSLASDRILARVGRLRWMSYILSVVVLAEYLVALPLLPSLIGLPFTVRVLVVFGLVTPLGVCLGTFFPTALEQLKPWAPAFVPWAWGINGIFSVLAPLLSVAVSMTWGISALLLCAVPVYLLAGLVFPDLGS